MAVRTTRDAILQTLIDRLVAKGAAKDASQVLLIAKRNDPSHLVEGGDLLFRVGPARIEWDTPGGRVGAKKVFTLGVYARVASALDKGMTDRDWLIAQETVQDAVYDALLDFLPETGDLEAMTTEPLHVVSEQSPEKDDDDVWGDCLSTWEVHYLPSGIDINDPG